ncbi:MAG: hypothetical protein KDJ87_06065 [Rhizobiaceae bacterium]|nr:hypothetical protein [Rhizobiaceae bacterium]
MPATAQIMNVIMRDGTRHFLTLRETCRPDEVRARLETAGGIRVCQLSRGGFQWRMWFQCLGWRFSIANPFGELWFFVEDPGCPEDILRCLRRRIVASLR